MTRVVVIAPDGRSYQLDTPDPFLVGTWLKELFDFWQKAASPLIPTRFMIEIS